MLYPYKFGSNSAKNLAMSLGIKRIRHENSKFKGHPNKLIINWGASSMPDEVLKCKILNHPEAVQLASNKLSFFNCVKDKVNIPEFTTEKHIAKAWLDEGQIILSREKLSGHSGEGIVLLSCQEEWDVYNHGRCKMYVKYIPKIDEYRVHVVDDKVIDVRRKALRKDVHKEHADWKIRNHHNGFVFVMNDVNPPQEVLDQAILSIHATGLDFGAVDVIWNNFRNTAYVLEINTAPGLEGSSVDNYKEAFQKFYEDETKYVKRMKIVKIKTLDDLLEQVEFENQNPQQNPEGYLEAEF